MCVGGGGEGVPNCLDSRIYIQRVLIEIVGKGYFDYRFDLLPPQMAQMILVCFKDTSPECILKTKFPSTLCIALVCILKNKEDTIFQNVY